MSSYLARQRVIRNLLTSGLEASAKWQVIEQRGFKPQELRAQVAPGKEWTVFECFLHAPRAQFQTYVLHTLQPDDANDLEWLHTNAKSYARIFGGVALAYGGIGVACTAFSGLMATMSGSYIFWICPSVFGYFAYEKWQVRKHCLAMQEIVQLESGQKTE